MGTCQALHRRCRCSQALASLQKCQKSQETGCDRHDRDPRRMSMCITHGRAAIRVTIFLSGPFMLHCLKRFRRRQQLQLTRIPGGRSVISLQTRVGLTVASTATRGALRRVSSRWGSSRWQMPITWSRLADEIQRGSCLSLSHGHATGKSRDPNLSRSSSLNLCVFNLFQFPSLQMMMYAR